MGDNLGNSEAALHSYQEALRTATEAHSLLAGDESTKTLIEACQRLAYMEYSWVSLEKLRKAIAHYQQCLPLALDFWRQKPGDPVRRSLLAYNYKGLGNIEDVSREPDKAVQDFRAALQIIGNDLNGDEEHDMRLPSLYELIGFQLEYLGIHNEALVNFRKAVTITETRGFRCSRQQVRLASSRNSLLAAILQDVSEAPARAARPCTKENCQWSALYWEDEQAPRVAIPKSCERQAAP